MTTAVMMAPMVRPRPVSHRAKSNLGDRIYDKVFWALDSVRAFFMDPIHALWTIAFFGMLALGLLIGWVVWGIEPPVAQTNTPVTTTLPLPQFIPDGHPAQ